MNLSGCGEWTKTCENECVDGGGPIPNLVHFIKSDNDFCFYEWVAVLAARKAIKPKKIFVYSVGEIKSCWWNRTRPFVEHYIVPSNQWVKTLNGRNVTQFAHKSDFLRNSILYKIGGIYSDTDSIATKSFDDLLHGYQAVIARQLGGKPGNGLLVVQKQSCFICAFASQGCQKFDGKWETHSIRTLNTLIRKQITTHLYKNVKVLGHTDGFFPFSWTVADAKALFEKDMKTLPFPLQRVYAIHLFNAARNPHRYQERFSHYTWLSESPSPAAHVFRSALPNWFNETYLNVSICVDPPQL